VLLGHTSLIERRSGHFVVRQRREVERLLKRAYGGEPPVDRLMSGLARVAAALNANDQCMARIAAVHIQVPDLPSTAARKAMAAEDWLIKHTHDVGGGSASWNPALHPRTGTPPNAGWFAPTDREHDSSQVHVAENRLDSHRTDAAPATDTTRARFAPDYSINQRVDADSSGTKDKPPGSEFWSNIRSAVSKWLQETVPEYEIDSGRVVGERPRW
jgi:hypothetical protein